METQQQKTNIKSKSAAQASSKTIVGEAKRPLSEKTLQGIAELRALSEEANRIRMAYALAGGVMPSVNTVLLCMYEDQAGCKDFRTFLAWKNAGYSVKKGEKAFRLWGQPIKKGGGEELPDDAPEGTVSDESASNKTLWPTCCVFNESQVELISGV